MKNKETTEIGIIVKLYSQEDAELVKKALKILDEAGYTICHKNSLVLQNEMTDNKVIILS